MPASLSKDGDKLVLSLSGHPDFREALSMVKRIPGRRFDPDTKNWTFPANEQTAMRLVHTVNPSPDAVVLGWLKHAAARVADDLTSALPTKKASDLMWRPPKGLKLFDFQPAAIDFLANIERVLLADDMGLGKTIESIAAVEEWCIRREFKTGEDHHTRPRLVIAGTTKLGDWKEEIEKWTPGAPVLIVPGDRSPARRRKLISEFERDYAPHGGWMVINHEQVRASDNKPSERGKPQWVLKQPWFAQQEWLAVIADEAHRFKNRSAQQTGGLHQIDATLKYALTGTAIINSPDEVWAILAWIRDDQYEEWSSDKITYWQFLNTYVESYDVPGRGKVITGVKNADDLRFELADKMARRTKKLLQEKGLIPAKLPVKTRTLTMKPGQQAAYDQAQTELWLTMEADLAALPEERQKELADKAKAGTLDPSDTWIQRLMPNAAAKYAALKQIATSPGLLGGEDVSSKLDAIIEDIEDEAGKPFVVFTWHKRAAELIAERLGRKKIRAEAMHGDVPYLERTEIVRRFNEGATQVLVTTIKTGGEGLNLVRADTALFAELSERVTDNDQAVDRLWRLGQENVVTEVHYRTANTVETDKQTPRLRMKELVIGATMGRDREDPDA